ncbi:MAG: copper resistance protein CopC/CopD, partial [Candidatus Pacebacteria bacterium]|nr:copper resistance protein CopC/CopD [Candidatus Paceibacterota bacterium]
MNRTLILAGTLLALFLPAAVFAHASPVDMQPGTGQRMPTAPSEISIRFSERLEPGSSRIRVTDPSGAQVQGGSATVDSDGYTLRVPVRNADGVYTVAWSVVSRDDGHFTRGSYAYSVGSDIAPLAASEEVVQIATTQEAIYMFVEFLGNSILWGSLALYILSGDTRARRIFVWLALAAAVFGFTGAAGQLFLKTYQLAALHETGLREAFHLYRHTSAGISTLVRLIALSSAGVLAAVFGFRRVRTTVILLGVPLFVFAYFRAIVSHASANPFYPELSIAVNVVHVIEKDLWLGSLVVLCVLMVSRVRESVVPQITGRVIAMLSANLAVLTVTAGYIIWLHLKSFSNVTTTNWGQVFVPLLTSAIFLVALHVYHVVMYRVRPQFAQKYFAPTIGAQAAAAALVVFFTSIVIITSPPSHTATQELMARDGVTVITLSRAPYEDGMVALSIRGADGIPTVFIGPREGGLLPALEKRYEG